MNPHYLTFALAALMLAGCTNVDKTVEILTQAGYKNIQTTGYSCFACGKDDTFSTGFVATSPNGTQVKGTVCGGFMKGYTIRFN